MSGEDEFDVIVVGGGVAGLSTGYFLAKKGINTVVLERGPEPGAKNMFGGRIYAHVLEKYFPEYKKEAPIERWVTRDWFLIMDEKRALLAEYRIPREESDSFTTYLTKFNSWLAQKAEEAGALVAPGAKVDSLLIENGKIVGITSEGEEMKAKVVVVAEGANSLLLEKAGLKKPLKPKEVAVGVKEVFRLDVETINSRFGIENDEGVAALVLGYPIREGMGGGFIYTMKNEVTLGIVSKISNFLEGKQKSYEAVEDLRTHPRIYPLVKDGLLLEYSARIIVEHPRLKPQELLGDGYLVVGAAAGFELNTGFTVRGVDLAIESAKLAVETIEEAIKKNDFSKRTLKLYIDKLKKSFVWKELSAHKKTPKYLDNKRIYSVYPQLLLDILGDLLKVNGEPKRLGKVIKKNMKGKVSRLTVLKDLVGAVRSL